MRIALLCDQYPPRPHGGIGTFTQTHARALAAAGHDVTVIGIAHRDEEHADGLVRVLHVGRTRLRGIAWWRDRMRLLAAVEQGDFDVVETPDYDGRLPRGAGDTPAVVRLHGTATVCATFGAKIPPRRVRWCERETLRHATTCIHPSRHALDAACHAFECDESSFGSTLVRHPAPIFEDSAVAARSDDIPAGRIVLFVGSLWGYRGVAAAAAAAALVLTRHDDAHAVFVGEDGVVDGCAASDAIRRAVGTGLGDRVHLTGRVPHADVARWMRAADVFLYPSEHEAFGLVLLEAMREGLPIVGSDRGACAEIVSDERTGLLASAADPEALASAVERLLADSALRQRLTVSAHDDLRERFSAVRCAAESVRVYERAIASGREQPE